MATSLTKKLGIKAGHRVALLGEPTLRALVEPLPPGAVCVDGLEPELDVIVLCADGLAALEAGSLAARAALVPAGGLWLGWPKKASKRPTDLDFAAVQALGLSLGLVDNKVCAIDATWSGLRFVYRLADRPEVIR